MRDSAKVIILLSISFLLAALEDAVGKIIPFSGLLAVMAAGVIILKKSPGLAGRLSVKYSKLWVGAELLLFVLVGASVRIDAITAAGFKAVLMIISLRHLNIGIFHPSFSVGTASKILVMTSHYSVFFLARRKNSGYKISDI